MATGLKANNVLVQDGVSWEDRFQIDVDSLTYATRANFHVQRLADDSYEWVVCLYTGSTAIDTDLGSALDNLPIGSQVMDVAAKKLFVKTAASTWYYGTMATGSV